MIPLRAVVHAGYIVVNGMSQAVLHVTNCISSAMDETNGTY